jgi:hypothetical protein
MDIFSREVLQMITEGEDGWEEMLPPETAEMIKSQNLFGYRNNNKVIEQE